MLWLKLLAEEYDVGQQSSPESQWYKLRNERRVICHYFFCYNVWDDLNKNGSCRLISLTVNGTAWKDEGWHC